MSDSNEQGNPFAQVSKLFNGGQSSSSQDTQTNQGSMFDGPLHGVRQQIDNQIGQAIDAFAGRIPGGERFTPQAKQAISGVLDNLQQQLETQATERLGNAGNLGGLGNLLGGNKGNQGGTL